MSDITHLLSSLKSKETQNCLPLQKHNWEKIVICTDLCLTKYITYIYTGKNVLDHMVKRMECTQKLLNSM